MDPTPAKPSGTTNDHPGGLAPFYLIVPDVTWMRRLVPLGVETVQLRLKDATADQIKREIDDALEICRAHRCQLIVNDHWQAAIAAGADYIHLGQEDLATADRDAIRAAGARLGISTHSEAELAIALSAAPDYVALGPIYETKLKKMTWAPQGLDKLGRWRALIGNLPLVGIAGLTIARASGVRAAGADSCAVITDVMTHPDPEQRVREWLAWSHAQSKSPSPPLLATGYS